jgi:hypothetical protein
MARRPVKKPANSVVSEKWPADKVERWFISKLTPYANNPRIHAPDQIQQIKASIKEWGWTIPILVDEKGLIIAGHGRLTAAEELGITEVPVMVARGWTEAQKRAYVIADNQIPQNAGWDTKLLRLELGELAKLDYALNLTGFDNVRLATFGVGSAGGQTDPDEAAPVLPSATSKSGDVWLAGAHRIMCGDSTSQNDLRKLIDGNTIDIANCDPPYGIKIVKSSGKVGGSKPFGSVHSKGRAGLSSNPGAVIAVGNYPEVIGDDSTATAISSYKILASLKISAIVMWGGNYYAEALPPSRCWLVWDKEVSGTFADVELAWTNCDHVAKLFRHQWNGLMKASEKGERRVHPTQKPVALAEWVIETVGSKAKNYMDLFLGSGSSLIACERKSIACFGLEMSEHYVDASIRRWQKFTGRKATLQGTKKTFDQVEKERSKKAA